MTEERERAWREVIEWARVVHRGAATATNDICGLGFALARLDSIGMYEPFDPPRNEDSPYGDPYMRSQP